MCFEADATALSTAIRYYELDPAGRLAVWRKFFEMAGCQISDTPRPNNRGDPHIALKDLHRVAEKRFNGRTIKNLVRTSQSLASSM